MKYKLSLSLSSLLLIKGSFMLLYLVLIIKNTDFIIDFIYHYQSSIIGTESYIYYIGHLITGVALFFLTFGFIGALISQFSNDTFRINLKPVEYIIYYIISLISFIVCHKYLLNTDLFLKSEIFLRISFYLVYFITSNLLPLYFTSLSSQNDESN